eukprot:gnl/MRDRNA2_/MRDRNA2_71147_c0_seq1.p1 gnl/MRDRNA2_/MRDRNA2_71147_c0~~gnl/MRDRNA2_/MRDRNA2_71147_c0_seq1.p1  ORF type:complete len:275 (+),score=52.10 gnl/MRDRNA2_/MRDRNA2_71147_c0_seq1:61-885(+)
MPEVTPQEYLEMFGDYESEVESMVAAQSDRNVARTDDDAVVSNSDQGTAVKPIRPISSIRRRQNKNKRSNRGGEMASVKRPRTVKASRKKEQDITIFVNSVSGKIITLNIKTSDTVDDVKAKIEDSVFGIRKECQELILADTVLQDGFRVSDYAIEQESTIHLVIMSTVDIRCVVDINLRELGSRAEFGPASITKTFKSGDVIGNVRLWVTYELVFGRYEYEDEDPLWMQSLTFMNLYFKGIKLRDEQTISDCGINSDDCELQFLDSSEDFTAA